MTTALITHPAAAAHQTPPGHPEQVARITRLQDALADRDVLRREAPRAQDSDLRRAHPQSHVDHVRQSAPAEGFAPLDADTWMSAGSLEAALRAVGGAVHGVDMVLSGEAHNAFVAMRPPGHHAEKTATMGFCLFGTVAIAVKHALDHHGLSRVAVMDFDVHHGNGTQDLLQDDGRVFFCSSHQSPLWPGTGRADEVGPHGTVLNIPLDPGTDGPVFRSKMEAQALPALAAFRPELLLISAGFDAHRDDPLAGLNLLEADFAWVTERLCALAAAQCGGRVVSCLEGGYDLDALARSAAAHVDVLIAQGTPAGP